MQVCPESRFYTRKVRNNYDSNLSLCSVVSFKKDNVDPDSIGKDSRYTDDFKVEVHFKSLCERGCRPELTLRELCRKC